MCRSQNNIEPVTPNVSKKILEPELSELMTKAVRGDGEAAFKVALHFEIGLGHKLNGIYWFLIGAENGHSGCQWNLSYDLTYDDEMDARGVFWVKTAANNKEEYAIKKLKRQGIKFAEPLSADSEFVYIDGELSDDEITRYKEVSLQGSQKAVLVLVRYYQTIGDIDSLEYWYRIGAQNGNGECQYNYGKVLSTKPDMLNKERGKYWIDRAYQNGYIP
jgi:TPR repeat protein